MRDDTIYSLTPEEMKKKKQLYNFWRDYLKKQYRARRLCSKNALLIEYDLSCRSHYNMENNTFIYNKLDENNINEGFKIKENYPRQPFVPLSPKLLHNILVNPKLINFGTVDIIFTQNLFRFHSINNNFFTKILNFFSGSL